MVFKTENLVKSFSGFIAVDDVSLRFERQTITSIIGPNGAGKTTFINLCTGLLKPDSGRVLFEGREITNLAPEKRVKLGISRTFQIVSIFPMLTVEQNIRIPLLSRYDEVEERLDELIEIFGFRDVRDKRASELSHGDQKILDIAMAVATKPKVLFLDEPMAGVNPVERTRISNLITELQEKEKLTVIIVEHDMEVVFKLAERIVVMNRGKVIADGKPDEIKENETVKEIYLRGVGI